MLYIALGMLADCLPVPGTQWLHHVAPQDQTPTQASGPAAFAALPGILAWT